MFFKKMCQHPSSVRLNLTLLAQVLLTPGGGGGYIEGGEGGSVHNIHLSEKYPRVFSFPLPPPSTPTLGLLLKFSKPFYFDEVKMY